MTRPASLPGLLILFLPLLPAAAAEPWAPPFSSPPNAKIRVTVSRAGDEALAAASRPGPDPVRDLPDRPAAGPEAKPAVPDAVPGPPPEARAEPPAPPAAAPAALAAFDGKPITVRDVARELLARRGEETLDWLIGRAILEKELASRGLEVAETEVDQRLAEHLAGLGRAFPGLDGAEALVKAASGMRLDEYRRRAVWVELALRRIMRAALPPSEDRLRAYYAERRADFIQPERVRVSQVFVAPRADPDNGDVPGRADWELAERQILEAHSRLRMRDDFAQVARAYGTGGQLSRWVGLGELLRELEDAAFSMRPGSFSNPIRTSLGFHIIRTEEKAERRIPAFEEVRETVLAGYEETFFLAMAGEFMARLRSDALRDGVLVVGDVSGILAGGGADLFQEESHGAATAKPD